jgi:hypothetical protein
MAVMEQQKPSVGRIVHYVAYGTPGGEFRPGVCRAAIISQVHDDSNVGVVVLNPTGLFFNVSVPYSEPELVHGGTWHWPERV